MRGQLWSLDLSTSLVIFFFSLVVLISAWNYAIGQQGSQTEVQQMAYDAMSVSDQIIRLPGTPADWNQSTVQSIGLASSEGILNDTKVERFITMNYDSAKRLLGVGGDEFSFKIFYMNGSLANTLSGLPISTGYDPSDYKVVSPVERYVMLNDNPVKLDLTLWSRF